MAEDHGPRPEATFGDAQILERAGCPIHYWLAGPEDKPLLVLTHGAVLDHRLFAPQFTELSRTHRVLVWDIPGHGRSQPLSARFSIRRAADDLLAILDRVGCQTAALVGHSMGGDITQELVFRHASRVTRTILMGCISLTAPRAWSARISAHIAPIKLRFAQLDQLRRGIASSITVQPHVREYALSAMEAVDQKTMVSIWSAIARAPHAEANYTMPCPCLLLMGAKDDLGSGILRQGAEQWAGRDANCQIVLVPDAAHLSSLDNPDFVNRQIEIFLQQR